MHDAPVNHSHKTERKLITHALVQALTSEIKSYNKHKKAVEHRIRRRADTPAHSCKHAKWAEALEEGFLAW
jgi:ethanolamine utilization protein EutP (predicted NTPase)